MTNYQIPQNALLKYKFFYQFLMTHERDTAREVREEYVDTMSKILYSYFKMYTSRLMKLQVIKSFTFVKNFFFMCDKIFYICKFVPYNFY